MKKRLALSAVTLLSCVAVTQAAIAAGLEKVTVRLDWTPWAVHAPYHLAQEKGWFKDAGLDVDVEDGNGSVSTVQIVGSNDSFDIGQAALASMVIARNKGIPVKAVAPFLVRNDIGVLVPADSDMESPADLKGKTVVYTAGSLEAPFIDSFLAAGDLTRDDINLLSVDASSKAATYMVGRADAVVSTIPFVYPSVVEKRDSKVIPFADYGLDMVSFGMFSSEDKLAERGEVITQVGDIISRAWEYIYDGNEQEAVDAIIAQRPQARLDKDVLLQQLEVLKEYFSFEEIDKVGVNREEDWQRTIETLDSVGYLERDLPVTDYYYSGE